MFISIAPVNDPPTFTKGPDQTVPEDPGMQIIINWATNISAGPNENQSSVFFVITNNTNPSLFSIQPAINNGNLTYAPALHATGTATITFFAQDNRGTANGGVDSSPPQSFTITVVPRPVLLTEESTQHAIALDLVNLTRDPFSLTSPFNLGSDQRRRVSLFVWRLGLLPSDTPLSVSVVASDNQGRTYDLAVEALNPVLGLIDVTQVVVRLPDTVAGAPRDLQVQVTLRGISSNQPAFIKIAAP